MGLHSASSTITSQTNLTTINVYLWAPSSFYNHNQVAVPAVSFCGADKNQKKLLFKRIISLMAVASKQAYTSNFVFTYND